MPQHSVPNSAIFDLLYQTDVSKLSRNPILQSPVDTVILLRPELSTTGLLMTLRCLSLDPRLDI